MLMRLKGSAQQGLERELSLHQEVQLDVSGRNNKADPVHIIIHFFINKTRKKLNPEFIISSSKRHRHRLMVKDNHSAIFSR